jgi:hypothetical protein
MQHSGEEDRHILAAMDVLAGVHIRFVYMYVCACLHGGGRASVHSVVARLLLLQYCLRGSVDVSREIKKHGHHVVTHKSPNMFEEPILWFAPSYVCCT